MRTISWELSINEDDFDYDLDKVQRLPIPINSTESTRQFPTKHNM